MSEYRLFIEIGVFEQIQALRSTERRRVMGALELIRQRPSACSDYIEQDIDGRPVHIHIVGRVAVKYWEDFADRHLKILSIQNADRSSD